MTLDDNEEKFLKHLLGRIHHALAESEVLNYKYDSTEWDSEADSKTLVIRYKDDGGKDDEEDT